MENSTDKENNSTSLVADYGSSDTESIAESDILTASNDSNLNEVLDDAIEMSEMVLKNNIINACAHGPLSNTAKAMSSSFLEDSRRLIVEKSESDNVDNDYREMESDESISSDSSSEQWEDIEEVSSSDDDLPKTKDGKILPPKVKGELDLDDLPPIEDLKITVPEDQCVLVGKVDNIIDKLVTVQALPNMPSIDLDSVLFLEKGSRTLGKVFDVYGPVTEPYYAVRFNSPSHIKECGIQKGMEVYIAPKTDHTSYVFLAELMKIKGSDASWLNDIEPPTSQVEYSDDEQERAAKKAAKERNRPQQDNGETSDSRLIAKPGRRGRGGGQGPSRGRGYNPNPFGNTCFSQPPTFPVDAYRAMLATPRGYNQRLRAPNFIPPPNRMYLVEQPVFSPPPMAAYSNSRGFMQPQNRASMPLAFPYNQWPRPLGRGRPAAMAGASTQPLFGGRFTRPPPPRWSRGASHPPGGS